MLLITLANTDTDSGTAHNVFCTIHVWYAVCVKLIGIFDHVDSPYDHVELP